MTETIISLLSILVGIIGIHVFAYFSKNKPFGFTGNSIIGVFSSIFMIKTFGRLGFTPNDIVTNQQVNYFLLSINLSVSILSGVLGFLIALKINKKLPN